MPASGYGVSHASQADPIAFGSPSRSHSLVHVRVPVPGSSRVEASMNWFPSHGHGHGHGQGQGQGFPGRHSNHSPPPVGPNSPVGARALNSSASNLGVRNAGGLISAARKFTRGRKAKEDREQGGADCELQYLNRN
jgi:hypothetical protein